MKALTHAQPFSRNLMAQSRRLIGAPLGLRRALRQLLSSITEWWRRVRLPRRLESVCELDDRMLEDIGLTCGHARHDTSEPVWWR
jgi:uncharacterized protein YjiS (DUF1127 family)